MTKIIKSFNGATESEIESAGFKPLIEWEQLNPAIEKAVLLRSDEVIKGYSIDDKGITVSISKKLGRRISNNE